MMGTCLRASSSILLGVAPQRVVACWVCLDADQFLNRGGSLGCEGGCFCCKQCPLGCLEVGVLQVFVYSFGSLGWGGKGVGDGTRCTEAGILPVFKVCFEQPAPLLGFCFLNPGECDLVCGWGLTVARGGELLLGWVT